jgi:hypothetical protein
MSTEKHAEFSPSQSELEFQVLRATKVAIHTAVQNELVGYGKPLSQLCNKAIERHSTEIASLLDKEITSLISSDDFRCELRDALRSKMAKLMASAIGGELEKRVNDLKSNPVMRAKITLALNQMVSELNSTKEMQS